MKGFKNIWRWAKRYFPLVLFIICTTLLLQLLYSYIPLIIQYAIKLLGGSELESTLPSAFVEYLKSIDEVMLVLIVLALSIIIVQIIRLIFRFTDSFLRGFVSEKIALNMRNTLYKKVNTLSYSYHNKSDVGDLIQRCTTDVETSCSFMSGRFPELVNIIGTIAIGAYQVGRINLALMFVSIISIPIFAVSSIIYFRYVNKQYEAIENEEAKMTTIIQECLSSNRVVKAFNREKYEFDKFDKQNKKYRDEETKINIVSDFYWGISDAVAYTQYGITLIVAIYLAKNNLVDAGDITACLLLLGMLIWPIRGLGRIIGDLGRTIVSVNRIDEVLQEKSEYNDNENVITEIKGNIVFDNVSFKFDDDDKYLLENISFNIEKGQMVALVGKTGCGKSTIVNILTRMLDYTSGHIYIDGTELKTMDKKHVRRNIALVSQDPFLFSKTVYDNINITKKGDDSKVYRAAKIANIDEDIRKFDKGYETLVGEKGTTLSGGQKQRVAIARSLVSDKPVLIFDDSLSAVDSETDILIRRALKKSYPDLTIIVITHRTSTAMEADKIIVFDEGKILEMGTHDELVQNNKLYNKLWKLQGNLEEEFEAMLKEEENES